MRTALNRRRTAQCTVERFTGGSNLGSVVTPPGGVLSRLVRAALPTDRRSSSRLQGDPVHRLGAFGLCSVRRRIGREFAVALTFAIALGGAFTGVAAADGSSCSSGR